METPVYYIPIGDYWHLPAGKVEIVYAPFSGRYILRTAGTALPQSVVDKLQEPLREPATAASAADELAQVDILLNYSCNFHCVYCYSAQGRNNTEVHWDTLQTFIDRVFARPVKDNMPRVRFSFSGGGEPLMSYPLLQQAIEYIEHKSQEHPRLAYSLAVVTNGSLLNKEKIEYLKEHNVRIVVSYEILKSYQDTERGCYEAVTRNICLLDAMQADFGIRCNITKEAVEAMPDMVREIAGKFPDIKSVTFDTILAPNLFRTPEELEKYYDSFLDMYYKAKDLATAKGIEVACMGVELKDMLRNRGCEAKFCLTPRGTLTACSRVSSPDEPLYPYFQYGNAVHIDEPKIKQLMSMNTACAARCKDCFARWNCGGGCTLFFESFPKEYHNIYCAFRRNALRKELYYDMCRRIPGLHRQIAATIRYE